MKTRIKIAVLSMAFIILLLGCNNGNSPSNQANNGPIVCFGDSLTEGFGASRPGEADKSKSYPAFLETKVTVPVHNAGISGDTAAAAAPPNSTRVEKDVLSKNPQLVIVLLGANDLFRQRPASETKANLQSIINKLKDGSRKIYLASFIGNSAWEASVLGTIPGLASTELAALLNDYKKMFTELTSENRDVGFIPDIWTGVWGIHMSDPIHPDEAGYRIMSENIFKVIKPYLQANNLLK
jgi:acyl-CoA thioesterase-1